MSSPRSSATPGSTVDRLCLLAVVLALVSWSAAFIWCSSVEHDGRRWFVLFDDAMISMTYARNLLAGHGLTWARWGEPLEGFTCPLWTLAMVPFNLGAIPAEWRSLGIQILSLGILCLHLDRVRRLTVSHFGRGPGRLWLPAVVLTAGYYPLAHWALMGMETGLQALLITVSVHLALDVAAGRDERILPLCVLSSAALLLRPDMVLLVAACLGLALPARGAGLRARPRRWYRGLALVVGAPLAYQVFRLLYFGDPLPNTYYLKLTGVALDVRILRGALVFGDFVRPWWWLAAAVVVLALVLAVTRPAYRLALAVVGLYWLYSIYVGGDAWESGPVLANRWISPVMPLFFVLVTGLFNEAVARWPGFVAGTAGRVRTAAAAGGLVALVALQVHGLDPRDLADPRWDGPLLRKCPLYPAHRTSLGDLRHIRALVDDDAVLAAVWAGIPAYFSDFRMVDMLGYNDRHIARLELSHLDRENARAYVPGHSKLDLEYVLGERRPDVVYRHWGGLGKFRRLASRHGYREVNPRIWVRRDSRHLRDTRGAT